MRVRGMTGVTGIEEFVDPALLPKGQVRVAALDGENSDPADGLTLEPGLRAKTLWGELAYRLAGVEGYRRVQESDQRHVASGAETIRELFGGEPTLIMIDEVSVYLRKVERRLPGCQWPVHGIPPRPVQGRRDRAQRRSRVHPGRSQ